MLDEKSKPNPNQNSHSLAPNGVDHPHLSVAIENPEVEMLVIHIADSHPTQLAGAAASTADLEGVETRSPTSVSSRLEDESQCEEDNKRQQDVLESTQKHESHIQNADNGKANFAAMAPAAKANSAEKTDAFSKNTTINGPSTAQPPAAPAPASSPSHAPAASAQTPMPPLFSLAFLKVYFSKFLGQHGNAHVLGHRKPLHLLITFIGATLGIGLLAFLQYNIFEEIDVQANGVLLIGSFGASATLLYGAPTADFSQPRNVWGGHVISALSGLIIGSIIPDSDTNLQTLRAAFAVAFAIVAMNVTHTVHPPGGATALIAVTPNPAIQHLGWLYLVLPVAIGAAIMILVAILVNNCTQTRHYPKYWI